MPARRGKLKLFSIEFPHISEKDESTTKRWTGGSEEGTNKEGMEGDRWELMIDLNGAKIIIYKYFTIECDARAPP